MEMFIPRMRGPLDTRAQHQLKMESAKPAEPVGTSQSKPSPTESTEPGFYRGWYVTYDSTRPVTGRWRAERFGVGMCNNSKESLIRMIDVKSKEQQKWAHVLSRSSKSTPIAA